MNALGRALVDYHRRAISVPRAERVARALAAQIGRASSLLDVGAGDGEVARAVGERVFASRIEGVDVKLRPTALVPITAYDGERLPFPDGAFEAVTISDVLHHAAKPTAVLRECLRVASRVVAIKDHFRFGPVSGAILYAMDVAGNAAPGVLVRGSYFAPREWARMVAEVGGRFTGLDWPLQIHDAPFRWITRDRLQFAARIERAAPGAEVAPFSIFKE